MPSGDTVLVIGLGNDFRSDDRVGLHVARLIQADRLPHVETLVGVGDAIDLLDRWNDAAMVIVVDCAVSGGQAGLIHRFDALSEPIPEALFSRYSTHVFSVADALALGGALGRMPRKLIVYGIEAANCAPGTELTSAVEQAAQAVREAIGRDIMQLQERE